jgi:hypothetical protein
MYDYEIDYIHSTHMTYDNNCDAHLKLTWAHSVSDVDVSEWELDNSSSFGIENYELSINVKLSFRAYL